ncbi:MAG: zinc ABC transporter substrate-binding protein [Sedimentisphaerales bacterium]
MNKKAIYFVLGFLFVGVLTLIVNNIYKPTTQSNKPQVTASFYPLYFFSQQIAGDKADVINITPAGAEPHDYEPTAQDIAQIENSKMLVLNGGGLEAWGNNIKQNLNPKNTIVVTAGEGLTNQQVMENGQNIIDPHIWQSPPLAKQMVDKITQGFIQIDPTNKAYYQANSDALKVRLDNLDKEYRRGLSDCLEKSIITSHAAFGYLATTYGLNQVSIAGLSPDAEPSPQQLADIVKFAKTNNVKYIFFESLVSPKLSDTIATEVGAKTLVLNPIEGLTNEEISQGKNYFTEMQNNLANLKIALQCK